MVKAMEDITKNIEELDAYIEEFRRLLAIESKEKELSALQLRMAEPGFWDNPSQANKIVEKLKKLKEEVDGWYKLNQRIKDIKELREIGDVSYEEELTEEVNRLKEEVERFRLYILLSDRFDSLNAILEINSGAGGTEACDWAAMLFRMYYRWAEDKKFKIRILDEVRGEEVGYKNITFSVEGRYAYGYLKTETGVHRLVRISPFDANKRRHTSFASVAVYPELEDDIKVDIKPEELKIETFRASGHGGQHVNVTDSAVRITHLPTGIIVSCQNERSQYQNKQVALRVLRAKLYELKEREQQKEMNKLSGEKRKIEWGSQIRSYILFPYLLVKDHRTGFQENDALAVLDGRLDGFILAYLKSRVEHYKP